MAEFVYNNAKNTSTRHTFFEFNCGYNHWISYKENFNPRSKSKNTKKLSSELQNLMVACQQNLYYT